MYCISVLKFFKSYLWSERRPAISIYRESTMCSMFKLGYLIVVALVLVGSSLGQSKTPNPGFRTAITNNGLNYVLQVGLPILQSELSSIHIPDISGSQHVNVVGKVKYTLKNIHLSDLTFGQSSLVTKRDEGLLLTVSDISLHASADWHYEIHVLFPIKDSGSVDMSTSGVSLSVGVVIGADDKGHATLSTKECSFNVGHLSVHFHGGASWLYNLFDGQIADVIKKNLNDQICKVASKAINNQGSKALGSLPVLVRIDSVSAIDYALVKPPNFTDWYIETDHKGEFFPVSGAKHEAPFSPPSLPPLSTLINSTSCRMMYLWLTDYVANTAGLVYHQAGVLHYTVKPDMISHDSPFKLDTNTVSNLLGAPELQTKYPDMNMQVFLNTTRPPCVNITHFGANFTVPAEAEFYVITNNGTVKVFTIAIVAVLDAKVKLVEKADGKEVLVGDATYLKANFDVLSSNVGKINISGFGKLFNGLANKLIIIEINKFLNKGLPLPTVDGISFVNTKLSFGKGYIMVASDVTYKPSYLYMY